MTTNRKLAKLANAIRDYRGVTNQTPNGVKWKRPPQPQKAERVLFWLGQLGVKEPITALADIQEFKTYDEMRKWMGRDLLDLMTATA